MFLVAAQYMSTLILLAFLLQTVQTSRSALSKVNILVFTTLHLF
jgi:hypothetical protein